MTMRVDRGKVNDAKTILAGMGLTDMTPRAATDVFLVKVINQKAIPFPLTRAHIRNIPSLSMVRPAGDQAGFTQPVSTVERRYGKRRHASRGYLSGSND